MKSSITFLSLLAATATATPLQPSTRQQSSSSSSSSSSVATIQIYSDWPARQNELQTIEAPAESRVTELGPPAVGVCAQVHDRNQGCRFLAWFDREPDDPGAGVADGAEDLSPAGEFPPNSSVEVCVGHATVRDGVKVQVPLRRIEVVCP
ncbi:hypothetical protein PG993_005571 [Apiospora rasikravindrae]|uniref:Uncharacterized protein n=1 Tax=Apiospora rasikravindrae TaxID=990691 RepID=A0ABR1TGN2_9PEZI